MYQQHVQESLPAFEPKTKSQANQHCKQKRESQGQANIVHSVKIYKSSVQNVVVGIARVPFGNIFVISKEDMLLLSHV
jgi:hypothetical protein